MYLKLSIYYGVFQVISNLNLYNSVFNGNSSIAQKNTTELQVATEKQTDNNANSQVSGSKDNNVYLSTRAQKIAAISSEFFSGAPLTFDDIESLKTKLYQFGLISKGDYATLTNDKTEVKSNEVSENISTTSLTNFIGDFIKRLNKEDVDKKDVDEDKEGDDAVTKSETIIALTEALTTAKKILANVEEQKGQADFKSSLKNTLALLKETINDKVFEQLPLDDKIGLSKVHQALEIVDRLSPQRLNNDKVNQYIQLSFS